MQQVQCVYIRYRYYKPTYDRYHRFTQNTSCLFLTITLYHAIADTHISHRAGVQSGIRVLVVLLRLCSPCTLGSLVTANPQASAFDDTIWTHRHFCTNFLNLIGSGQKRDLSSRPVGDHPRGRLDMYSKILWRMLCSAVCELLSCAITGHLSVMTQGDMDTPPTQAPSSVCGVNTQAAQGRHSAPAAAVLATRVATGAATSTTLVGTAGYALTLYSLF